MSFGECPICPPIHSALEDERSSGVCSSCEGGVELVSELFELLGCELSSSSLGRVDEGSARSRGVIEE